MTHIVEIRAAGNDASVTMSDMRVWLDHFRYEPDTCRQFSRGAGVLFRLAFKIEREAVAFAAAFGGRVLG